MGVELTSALIVGQTYHIRLHTSLTTQGSGTNGALAFACDHLGALFTVGSYYSTQFDDLPGYAQVFTTSVVTDSTGWTEVAGTFVADSAYAFLTLGNFFNDAATAWDSIEPTGTHGYAYYYFDDVCVALDPSDCTWPSSITLVPTIEPVVFPLPFVGDLFVAGLPDGQWTFLLFDTNGKFTGTGSNISSNQLVRCSLPALRPGTYLIEAHGPERQRWRKVIQAGEP
ncbi:MAG: hypothetical protein IPJ76_00215 [Flavobacteriales bacterium]|nr:MAG: hypothetical protein IPJ76_00215 [Flavobacteriales bacterium]